MTTDEFKRLTESEQIAYLMRGGCVMPPLRKPAIREQVHPITHGLEDSDELDAD